MDSGLNKEDDSNGEIPNQRMIVGMILETLGIAMVVPLLALITDPGFTLKYPVLKTLIDNIGNPEPIYLVTCSMLLLLFIYVIRYYTVLYECLNICGCCVVYLSLLTLV